MIWTAEKTVWNTVLYITLWKYSAATAADKSCWLSSTSSNAYFFISKAVSSLSTHALRCLIITAFAEKLKH